MRILHDHGSEQTESLWRSKRALLTIACGVALAAAFVIGKLVPAAEYWAFLAALLVGLVPIARRAATAALAGTPYLHRDADDDRGRRRGADRRHRGSCNGRAACSSSANCWKAWPRPARGQASKDWQTSCRRRRLVEREGQTAEMAAESLAVGDVIVVRPGDRIPADGEIVEGSSEIDEAPVTGESTAQAQGREGQPCLRERSTPTACLRIRVTATAQGQHDRPRGPAGRGGTGKQGSDRAIHRPLFPLLHARGSRRRRACGHRAAAAVWWRMERVDLQGSRHPADRLSLRTGDLDSCRHCRGPFGRGASRPADEGRGRPGRASARSPPSRSTRQGP